MKSHALTAFFVLVLPLSTSALPLPAQSISGDPINFGEIWNSWPGEKREVFVAGYTEGVADAFSGCSNYLASTSRETVRKQIFVVYDYTVLARVVTDLYKDSANTFIRTGSLILIARDKLNGQDIEARLRNARANDRAFEKR